VSAIAGFECSLDGAAFSACASPVDYNGLAEGSHTFSVRAVDIAARPDPTPASFTWVIDLTAPTISGSRLPAANPNGWNNTPVVVSFQCSDVLSGLAAGSPPPPTTLSSEGANQSVSGTCADQVGNSASATV